MRQWKEGRTDDDDDGDMKNTMAFLKLIRNGRRRTRDERRKKKERIASESPARWIGQNVLCPCSREISFSLLLKF
jgi:hypothetical protein